MLNRHHPTNSERPPRAIRSLARTALGVAVGSSLALGFAAPSWAQDVNGTIYGTAPQVRGEAIQITGTTGFTRVVPVDASGKYSVTVPVGSYTVSLLRNGKVVRSKTEISPAAGGSIQLNFGASAQPANGTVKLSAVRVTANALPPIDVTTTNQVTTITAAQLERLPLERNAAAIAVLAPGVNYASAELGSGPLGTPLVTFGGASTVENAYYIDGLNTSEVHDGNGGEALPYNAVEQQQTFISGYGAKYGRSIGGVINQIGKGGSNTWHFGARVVWLPAALMGSADNHYFNNPLSTIPGQSPGDLQQYNKADRVSEAVYDLYLSGPIIRDKLFFYVSAEKDNRWGTSIGSHGSPHKVNYRYEYPKFYAKLRWNINDSNLLTLTGLQSSRKVWTSEYAFDYHTMKSGDFQNLPAVSKKKFRIWVANYTSYITDDLRLHAMVGRTDGNYESYQPPYPGFDPTLPYISSADNQNPALLVEPDHFFRNDQSSSTIGIPLHQLNSLNYRVDVHYTLGSHELSFGIDNRTTWDVDDGYTTTGPGYYWDYERSDPDTPIVGTDPNFPPYAAPPNTYPDGATGYWVNKEIRSELASVRITQRAQYIQDSWHVTPNLLVNAGLRSDQFTNYNSDGEPYIRLTKPQWAPRVGFSWDVHGDSSLKVFGNAGRYYIAVPLNVAMAVSAPVLRTRLYGTYSDIDHQTGEPIGFKPLPQNPSTGVSPLNQYGQATDPRISTAKNIKAEFSDNYVLGMQKAVHIAGVPWVLGLAGTYQRMDRVIDDYDDIQRECAAGRAQGYAWMTVGTCVDWAPNLLMINPGETQQIVMKGPDGGLHPVTFSAKDQGFDMGPKRRYYALDVSLGHRWDGKWSAKLDYVFSRTWGNSEGPVSVYSQQSGTYLTKAWDFPEVMEYSNGVLPSDRRHQFKVYGAYAVTPEWIVSGNFRASSGTPRLCRGYYGPDEISLHGGFTYHWCGGKPALPGSLGRTPWVFILNLGINYHPAWADNKLHFRLAVFHALNRQTPLFYNDVYLSKRTPNTIYGVVQDTTSRRAMRLSVSYDF